MTLLRNMFCFGELYVFPQVLFSRENFYSIPSNVFVCQAFLKFIFKLHFAETLKALWLLLSQDSLIIIALAVLAVKHFLNFFISFIFSENQRHKKAPRCPILPGSCPPSTFSAEGLYFCVRYVNRCFPFAIITRSILRFYSVFGHSKQHKGKEFFKMS